MSFLRVGAPCVRAVIRGASLVPNAVTPDEDDASQLLSPPRYRVSLAVLLPSQAQAPSAAQADDVISDRDAALMLSCDATGAELSLPPTGSKHNTGGSESQVTSYSRPLHCILGALLVQAVVFYDTLIVAGQPSPSSDVKGTNSARGAATSAIAVPLVVRVQVRGLIDQSFATHNVRPRCSY
jgi:hypothetical protein